MDNIRRDGNGEPAGAERVGKGITGAGGALASIVFLALLLGGCGEHENLHFLIDQGKSAMNDGHYGTQPAGSSEQRF